MSQELRQALALFATRLGFQVHAIREGPDSGTATAILLEDTAESATPPLSTEVADVPVRARCNRPFERSFRIDHKFLFIEYVFAGKDADCNEYITTFAIARDIVHCFWGGEPPVSMRDGRAAMPAGGPALRSGSAGQTFEEHAIVDEAQPTAVEVRTPVAGGSDITLEDASSPVSTEMEQGGMEGVQAEAPVSTSGTLDAAVATVPTRLPDAGHCDPTYPATSRNAEEVDLFEGTPPSPVPSIYASETRQLVRRRRSDSDPDPASAERSPRRLEAAIQYARNQLATRDEAMWCMIDVEGFCRVGKGGQDLETALTERVSARHVLYMIAREGRELVIAPKSAAHGLETPASERIFIVAPKRGEQRVRSWQSVFINFARKEELFQLCISNSARYDEGTPLYWLLVKDRAENIVFETSIAHADWSYQRFEDLRYIQLKWKPIKTGHLRSDSSGGKTRMIEGHQSSSDASRGATMMIEEHQSRSESHDGQASPGLHAKHAPRLDIIENVVMLEFACPAYAWQHLCDAYKGVIDEEEEQEL